MRDSCSHRPMQVIRFASVVSSDGHCSVRRFAAALLESTVASQSRPWSMKGY